MKMFDNERLLGALLEDAGEVWCHSFSPLLG